MRKQGRETGEEAKTQAEQTAQTSEQAAQLAAKGLEAMARSLEAAVGGGNGIDDVKQLHEAASRMDMGKLASLK